MSNIKVSKCRARLGFNSVKLSQTPSLHSIKDQEDIRSVIVCMEMLKHRPDNGVGNKHNINIFAYTFIYFIDVGLLTSPPLFQSAMVLYILSQEIYNKFCADIVIRQLFSSVIFLALPVG